MSPRTSIFVLVLSLAAAACSGNVDDPNGSSSSPSTGNDACAERGAYGDGVCDRDCAEPDPDCTAPECPDPSDPEAHYLAGSDTNPAICTRITFACPEGQTSFSDVCGCGCLGGEPEPPACPDPSDPRVHYMDDSNENPNVCLAMMFACEEGQTAFSNECGCGCIDGENPACPDPSDPLVHYVGGSDENPNVCLAILFACEEGQALFSNECGCGCIDEGSDPPGPEGDFCGGIGGLPCPDGYECIYEGDWPDASGTCHGVKQCGGEEGIPCPDGYTCVYENGQNDDTFGRCEPTPEGQFCGGIGGLLCPDGYTCIYEGDWPDAGGTCRVVEQCGGIAGIPCADGYTCVHQNGQNDDSFGWCEPTPEAQFCGGIGGFYCPEGFECVLEGDGPDAGGLCVKHCGGAVGAQCPEGFTCVYPNGADFGLCTSAPEGEFCGGFGNLPCPDGYECVLEGDWPDAGGICHASGD